MIGVRPLISVNRDAAISVNKDALALVGCGSHGHPRPRASSAPRRSTVVPRACERRTSSPTAVPRLGHLISCADVDPKLLNFATGSKQDVL